MKHIEYGEDLDLREIHMEREYEAYMEREYEAYMERLQETHMRNHATLGSDLEEIIKNFLNRAGSEDLGVIYQSYPKGKPYCEIERVHFLKCIADAFHAFQEREKDINNG